MDNMGEILVTSIIAGIVNLFTALGDHIAANPGQWVPIFVVFGGIALLSFLVPAARRGRRRRRAR